MGRIGGVLQGVVALALGLMLLIWNGCALGESGSTEARSPSWREVTNPPDSRFAPFASVWTGAEVLSWGGLVMDPDRPRTTPGPPDSGTPEDPNPTPVRDGLAYETAEDTWTRIPSAPVPALWGAAGVWTGEELLVWGDRRQRDEPERTTASMGAAYSPDEERWRRLPSAPEDPRYHRRAVWTGEEMILVGTASVFTGRTATAAYDPDADTWRQLPDLPEGRFSEPRPVWTGDELLVLSDGGKLAAYSPEADSWHLRSRSPLGERWSPTVRWTGERMIALGGSESDGTDILERRWDGAAYDPLSDRWTHIPVPPHDEDHRIAIGKDVVVADDDLVIILQTVKPRIGNFNYRYETWALTDDAGAWNWRRLPDPPSDLSVYTRPAHWTGYEIVYWGEAALSLR